MKWLSAIPVGAIELESTNQNDPRFTFVFFTFIFFHEIFGSTFWPMFSVWFTHNSNLLTKT